MKMELDRQVREAKNELEGIRLSYQKVAKDVNELKSKVVVPPVQQQQTPVPVAVATGGGPTVVTASPPTVSAPVQGGSFLNAQHSNTSYANVYYPAHSVNYNVSAASSLAKQMQASASVLKPAPRQGFTPAQKAKYDRNPAIEQLGINIVPRDIDNEDSPHWTSVR